MENDVKRRMFLAATVAGLVGLPFAVRYFRSAEQKLPTQTSGDLFNQYLKKYRKLRDFPILEIVGPSECNLALVPKIGSNMKYASYATTYLPESISDTVDGEPVSIMYREGSVRTMKSNVGQTVLQGGDSKSGEVYPVLNREFPCAEILLLVKENRLVAAHEKGEDSAKHLDRQAAFLYMLWDAPKSLNKGVRWNNSVARLKPFEGIKTDYEVIGFSEIASRKAIQVHFHSVNDNQLAAMKNEPTDPDITAISTTSDGNAWFDLETGLLIRQRNDYVINVMGSVPSMGENPEIMGSTVIQFFA